MKSTDDQIREILKRSDRITKRREIRGKLMVDLLSAFACIALLVMTAVYIPNLNQAVSAGQAERYGSLILSTSNMGYVVVAVIAFLLGVVTALIGGHCRELKKLEKESESEKE